jgi:hypothetical protein
MDFVSKSNPSSDVKAAIFLDDIGTMLLGLGKEVAVLLLDNWASQIQTLRRYD